MRVSIHKGCCTISRPLEQNVSRKTILGDLQERAASSMLSTHKSPGETVEVTIKNQKRTQLWAVM